MTVFDFLFTIKISAKKHFPLCIFISDFIAFIYLIIFFSPFTGYTDYEIFFLFYGLPFVLLFDWFLWDSKKFSWFQFAKFILSSLSSNDLIIEMMSLFFLFSVLFRFNFIYGSRRKEKVISSIFIVLFFLFVLFRFYTSGLMSSVILLGENILFLFPLLVIRCCYKRMYFETVPVNKWQMFWQDMYEIPISLTSWYVPFGLAYLLFFKAILIHKIFIVITILSCLFYDLLEIKQVHKLTHLNFILELIYKFGVIFLLLHIGGFKWINL